MEAQFAPTVKTGARVLASDPARDIAVLWVDRKLIASVPPVPLACAQPEQSPVEGQSLFSIGIPLRGQKRIDSGTVSRVEPHIIVFTLGFGSAGGPAFGSGAPIDVTTAGDQGD